MTDQGGGARGSLTENLWHNGSNQNRLHDIVGRHPLSGTSATKSVQFEVPTTDTTATSTTSNSREAVKLKQFDDFFCEDSTEPNLSQLLQDSRDSIQVPDLTVDLNSSSRTRSFFLLHDEDDNESSLSVEPPKKKVKFAGADNWVDIDREESFSLAEDEISHVAEEKSNEEDCSVLLSQSSDLETTTLESLLEAGRQATTDCYGCSSSLPTSNNLQLHNDEANTEQSQESLSSSQTSCLDTACAGDWANRSLDSLTTQYEDDTENRDYFDVDCLVDIDSVSSSSSIRLTNTLGEQIAPSNTPIASQSAGISAESSNAMYELAYNSLDSLSLYSSDENLPPALSPSPISGIHSSQSSSRTSSSHNSDHQVPVSSEDELASAVNELTRRRRLLNSCAAQVVPDILHIEE